MAHPKLAASLEIGPSRGRAFKLQRWIVVNDTAGFLCNPHGATGRGANASFRQRIPIIILQQASFHMSPLEGDFPNLLLPTR